MNNVINNKDLKVANVEGWDVLMSFCDDEGFLSVGEEVFDINEDQARQILSGDEELAISIIS